MVPRSILSSAASISPFRHRAEMLKVRLTVSGGALGRVIDVMEISWVAPSAQAGGNSEMIWPRNWLVPEGRNVHTGLVRNTFSAAKRVSLSSDLHLSSNSLH